MDDEMRMLGALLAEPGPAPEAVDRSRRRLATTMRAPARGHRTGWLAAGLGLTATATAATLAVVVSNPATPADPTNGPPGPLSGRQVLLAAAVTAESAPATSGVYWHTRSVMTDPLHHRRDVTETWARRDGRVWLSEVPGMVSKMGSRPWLRGTRLDFDDLQRLPDDPAALKARLLASMKDPGTGTDRRLHAVNLLQNTLDVPVPSKVRAAAFRALAAMPNITNLGRTSGGYRLKIAYLNDAGGTDGTEKIIVDPKVARLRVEGWSGFGDGGLPVGPATTTALGWTDHLSGKVVPWKKQIPYLNPK